MISKEKIAEILAKHDPQGLCSMGAPKDEYGSEAKMIYDSLSRRSKNPPRFGYIYDLVYNVFIRQFNWGSGFELGDTESIEVFINIAGPKELYLEASLGLYETIKEQK